tara:strand:- start:8977 stop:9882 length:906 start_codon:yes stop_codon:yes gene_type:complete
MFINELKLPFEKSLKVAKDIGAEYVWFSRIPDWPEIADLTDKQVDNMANLVYKNDLKLLLISASSPFKQIHLTDISEDSPKHNKEYSKDISDLIRSMEIAKRLDINAVLCYSFAWPGEYTSDKPTWPMRWATRGGIISESDMKKLESAFLPVVESAEKLEVDVVLSMMPWNYGNTTGNFRQLAERIGSPRIRVMWGPADNINCGESDATSSGFNNIRPYLHSLHVKDLHVNEGISRDFQYRPIGEGDVDFIETLNKLYKHQSDAVLSIATHFTPDSGSPVEAMQINYKNILNLMNKLDLKN